MRRPFDALEAAWLFSTALACQCPLCYSRRSLPLLHDGRRGEPASVIVSTSPSMERRRQWRRRRRLQRRLLSATILEDRFPEDLDTPCCAYRARA